MEVNGNTYTLNQSSGLCEEDGFEYCPDNYFYDVNSNMCIEEGTGDICPDGFTYNYQTEQCEEDGWTGLCPDGFVPNEDETLCLEDPYDPCPNSEYGAFFTLNEEQTECCDDTWEGPCPDTHEYIQEGDSEFCRQYGAPFCEDPEMTLITDSETGEQYCQKILETDPIDTLPVVSDYDCDVPPSEAGGPGVQEDTYNLGSELGEVVIEFNSGTLPDRWIVEWDGQVVIDTGWVGQEDFVSQTPNTGSYTDPDINTFGECLIANGDLDDGSQFYRVNMGVHPEYTDQKVIDRYNVANGTSLTISDLSGTNTGIQNNGPMTWGANGTTNPGGGTASFIKDKAVGEVKVTILGCHENCGATGWKYRLRCVEPMDAIAPPTSGPALIEAGNTNDYYGVDGGVYWGNTIDPDIPSTVVDTNDPNPNANGNTLSVHPIWEKVLNPNYSDPTNIDYESQNPGIGVGVYTDKIDDSNNALPTNTNGGWIGFTQCIELESSGKYVIGIAADNFVRFSIDSGEGFKEYVRFDGAVVNTFQYWWLFEVELSAGTHIIKIMGTNTGSNA